MRCNLRLHGNLNIYGIKLVKEFGIEWALQLQRDAAQKGNNYSREELEESIEEFKIKLSPSSPH